MENGKVIENFKKLSLEGATIKATQHYLDDYCPGVLYIDSGRFNVWRNKILTFIDSNNLYLPNFREEITNIRGEYPEDVDEVYYIIHAIIDSIDNEYIELRNETEINALFELENIFNKFHKIARQLRSRHDDRQTLNVEDEYDVQDLLHSLLCLYFEDIRAEEWTPSYAGGAVRMDFLLKEQEIVIETKKTRKGMTAKQLGEELIIDIEKYKAHPNCKKLYCFVYDPEGYLANPKGIQNDLEKSHNSFLKVFIKPE